MPKVNHAYQVPDIGALARQLARAARATEPATSNAASGPIWTHSRWLQELARAAGQPNYQAWLADAQSHEKAASEVAALSMPAPREPAPELDPASRLRIIRAAGQFDAHGKLLRWPAKRQVSDAVLWPLWMKFDAKRDYTEKEVTAILADLNRFGDPVTLRRGLINAKLLARESDCSRYWKLSARPDAESAALMAEVRKRWA